jgi:zinc transporter ZupT
MGDIVAMQDANGTVTFTQKKDELPHHGHGHAHSHGASHCSNSEEISTKSEGWLFLLSDFLHVSLDGLALGVAFASRDKNLAISTFIAIFAHEIPHRIGVVVILINANFKKWHAILGNGICNIFGIIGTLIGLSIGNYNDNAVIYTLAFVIGNFIYVSVVDMIPYWKHQKHTKVYFS